MKIIKLIDFSKEFYIIPDELKKYFGDSEEIELDFSDNEDSEDNEDK